MISNAWNAGWLVVGGLVFGGPLGGAAEALMAAGLYWAEINACEERHGCPTGGECDTLHNVCCGGPGKCEFFDPYFGTCKRQCQRDEYCDVVTQRCAKRCKQCSDYLVDDRKMPCGQVTNNCDQVMTCRPCPTGERCINRDCVKPECTPKTCDDLGFTCGPADDGCGGVVTCGNCGWEGFVQTRIWADWDHVTTGTGGLLTGTKGVYEKVYRVEAYPDRGLARVRYNSEHWSYNPVSCDGPDGPQSQYTAHLGGEMFGEIQWEGTTAVCPEFPNAANACATFFGPFMYGQELRDRGIEWIEDDSCGDFRRNEYEQDISVRTIRWEMGVPQRDENGNYVLEGSSDFPLEEGTDAIFQAKNTWRFVMTPRT